MPRRKSKDNGDNEPIPGIHMPVREIEDRLLEAASEDDLDLIRQTLKLEGVPEGSINPTISRLKKKGKLIFETGLTELKNGQVQALPVEALVGQLKLPTIVDGQQEIFDTGVHYGMNTIIMGIKLAQELSKMGVAQASPVIRMATEMRKAEGMSAQEAGQRAAEDALAGAIQYMGQQKPDIATVQNPLMGVMARAMEPALMQAFGKMFGAFGMGGGQPTQAGGQPQPQPGSQLPTGWTDVTKGEQSGQGEQTK